MAATGIPFADYANHPKPKRLYLDSSFVIALLFYELNKANLPVLRPKHSASFNFYQAVLSDGIELTGSILTYSEVLHHYCFVYPGGMFDLAKNYCATAAVSGANTPQEKFKMFLKRDQPACDAAWQTIAYRVAAIEHFFSTHNIVLRSPLPSPLLTNVTKDVLNYASILKDAFVAIEATDSVHLSLASYLDSDAVVTLDLGFLTADPFKIYYTS